MPLAKGPAGVGALEGSTGGNVRGAWRKIWTLRIRLVNNERARAVAYFPVVTLLLKVFSVRRRSCESVSQPVARTVL